MKVFYALLLFPLLANAVPENKTYPNSGATNATTNQQTDVAGPMAAPFSQGSDVVPAPMQQMQERPVEDPEAIKTGPYDKDGNYIYVKKKP
jgi:hypothetical protein